MQGGFLYMVYKNIIRDVYVIEDGVISMYQITFSVHMGMYPVVRVIKL
jgi:hypothetical protein